MMWKLFVILSFVAFGAVVVSYPTTLDIVTRAQWRAKPPKMVQKMPNPVPFVIVHHSFSPGACATQEQCARAMRSMQNFHQNDRGWNDIGYSFGVGGDGRAYEGRGWSAVGAHAPGYNNRSVGICVIGNWMDELPRKNQLETVKNLIEFGVSQGKISQDYVLLGHRQVRDTECPGDALFNEITKWPHFRPKPPPNK